MRLSISGFHWVWIKERLRLQARRYGLTLRLRLRAALHAASRLTCCDMFLDHWCTLRMPLNVCTALHVAHPLRASSGSPPRWSPGGEASMKETAMLSSSPSWREQSSGPRRGIGIGLGSEKALRGRTLVK
ncbi:hypothetical protein EYF80_064103 [Liparis tanakae]|uniref:Uncharacterized protein n=1 Tax=Liparis tanakae TaxID=230148 RepID=A0A4Z2EB47_9TELE|nr:hypothetical protein EYF80_064103 [Liparis tanakae]